MTVVAKAKNVSSENGRNGRGYRGAFRKVIASVMAAAIVATSAIPAAANDEIFFFRHKNPISWTPGTGVVDGEYAKGDDITVSFTGVIGQPFSKNIPVKTKEVVVWKLDNGIIQPGLDLAASTGVISGTPSGKSKRYKATLLGYSAKGDRIARAQITFVFHNAVGVPQNLVFYGHTDKYMFREIRSSVPVSTWESLTELPDDFKTAGRYLAGTPKQEYNTGVAFVGYDFAGNEVAFASGDLIVQDTPVIAHIDDQMRHPTRTFGLTGSVQYRVGELTWRLVPLDGMRGNVAIGPKNGNIRGNIPTFNTSLRFQAEVIDTDGSIGKSNVFTLSTPAPDTDIGQLADQFGAVGKDYSLQLTAKDLSGTQSWQVTAGRLPDGITLDPDTGVLSGRPIMDAVHAGIRIAVSTSDGGSAESQPFTFTVVPEAVGVSFAAVDARVGKAFASAGPTLDKGIINPYEFKAVEGVTLNDELDVNYDTAVVKGQIDVAGNYDVPFNFVNGNGYEQVFTQPINVHDLLSLAYDDTVTTYRRSVANVAPSALIGIIGAGAYTLASGTLPEGLSIDPATGAVVGTPTQVGEVTDISVKVVDASGESAVSNTFDVVVLDRPDVAVVTKNIDVERVVPNQVLAAQATNVFDGVQFEYESGDLPDSISVDEDGFITGITDAPLGVYPDIRIRATDGEGYTAVSDPFTVTVVAPKALAPLDPNGANDASALWTAGVPFSIELPRPSNAFGTVTYSLQSLPSGVKVVSDKLEGVIDTIGSYPYPLTLTDEAGRTLFGTFTLNIVEPMTAMLDGTGKRIGESVDDIFFDLPRGNDSKIEAILTNAILPVTYTFNGTLPDGISYADGVIAGRATTEQQTGDITLTVTDAVGTTQTLMAGLTVMQRLPLDLSYSITDPAGTVGSAIAAIPPTVKNAIGAISYRLSGTLPEGLQFDQTTGYIYGTPTKEGWSDDLSVTATDTDVVAPSSDTYGPFKIGIELPGLPSLAGTTNFTVRAGKAFERTIDVGNVTKPLTFGTVTMQDLPHGLILGTSSGAITGMLSTPGKYSAGTIAVVDALGRSKQTNVNITAVGPLEVAAPTATNFQQYGPVNAASVTTNSVGAVAYELASGTLPTGLTLNSSTGVIKGSTSVKGTFGNLRIKATDTTGDSASTETFALTIGERLPLEMNTQDSYVFIANKNNALVMPVVNAVGDKTFVQTGALPGGVEFFADTGAFKGRPAAVGTFPVTVTVTDSVGDSVTESFSLVSETNGKPINLVVYDYATRLNQTVLTAKPFWSNHVGTVNFWADETLEEKGLSIDPETGVITGVATEIMEFSPNVHITDETDRVTSKTINISVVDNLRLDIPERLEMSVNKRLYPYVYLRAANTTSAVTWEVQGAMPNGLVFSKRMGRFSGVPTEMGSFPVKVKATEKSGFMHSATADMTIVVTSDGLTPTVQVNPAKTGYYTLNKYVITPLYTNAKTGDVLTLAPDSQPFPKGMTLMRNTSGKYVLYKDAVEFEESGVYPGIKVRVTDVLGNFSDSEPFTIIYRSAFYYPNTTVTVRPNEPIIIPAPVPVNGKPSGTTNFAIVTDTTKGSWTIDKTTGAIEGKATSQGYLTVTMTDVYDGVRIRTVSNTVYVKIVPVTLSVPPTVVGMSGVALPNFTPMITNGLPTGVFSTTGNFPGGLTINPQTGAITGTPSSGGTYTFDIVYSDDYVTVSKSVTAYISQAAAGNAGYRQFRLTMVGRFSHTWAFAARGTSGHSLNHITSDGVNTVSSTVASAIRGSQHTGISFNPGLYSTIVLPGVLANGSIAFTAHGSGATVVVSASSDGQTWVEIGSRTLGDAHVTYTVPFGYVPTEPSHVDFKVENSAASQTIVQYSGTQANIVTTSRLSANNAAYPVVSWTKISGTIPAGISALPNADNTAIVYSGHPTQTGTFSNIVWRATDKNGDSKTSAPVTFTVTAGTAMTIASTPSNGTQTILSGRANTTMKVSVANVPYGQSGVDWTVTGNLPTEVKWAASNTEVTFSGIPYKPGTWNFNVVAKDRVKGTQLSKGVSLTVTATFDLLAMNLNNSNAANISCPTETRCGYSSARQEVLQLGVTEPVAGWSPRDSNNVGTAMTSVTLAPGYSLPPGITPVLSADKKFVHFAGKPTQVGTWVTAVRIRNPSGYIVEPAPVTFVVNP